MATGRRGTTSSSRCADPRSTTSHGRSRSAGKTPRRWTRATRSVPRCTGSRSTRASRVRSVRIVEPRPHGLARGAGAAHLSGTPARLPVRSRRRAQHRARVREGVRAGAPADLHRRPVSLVGGRDAVAGARACARTRSCRSSSWCRAIPIPTAAIAGDASRIGRERVLEALYRAGGERVAVYDLENVDGTPIYVHSKVCVVDDVWIAVGSDNLNRRSWTNDSELSCAVIDARLDDRAPADPVVSATERGVLARDTRLQLAREHLGSACVHDDDLVDPARGSMPSAPAPRPSTTGTAGGGRGPRPRGHLRAHPTERLRGSRRWGRRWVHALLLDPDGRPRHLRRRGSY